MLARIGIKIAVRHVMRHIIIILENENEAVLQQHIPWKTLNFYKIVSALCYIM